MPRLLLPSVLAAGLVLAGLSAAAAPAPGPTLSEQARAQANKRNALAFYERFFNQHDLSAAKAYIGDPYLQHNPGVPNGRGPFVQAFARIFAQYPQRHSEVVRAVAEGDLVMLHVHTVARPGERGDAIVDIFRFDGQGKIVEHWDVKQPVPADSASGNGMF